MPRGVTVVNFKARKEWEAKHGVAPYRLENVRAAYIGRAMGSIDRDGTTIAFEGAVNAAVSMDAICERVHHDAELSEDDLVFFDPVDKHFWVYPAGPDPD